MGLRADADRIMRAALKAAQPDSAVKKALDSIRLDDKGRLVLVALGKAAWQMAYAAHEQLQGRVSQGIVITKDEHAMGPIGDLLIREASHPLPDARGFAATREAMAMVRGLAPQDSVLLLISGGGSALFEDPLVPAEELQDITRQLLASGADIVQMNTLRKRLSGVKGGRFAQLCQPARVYAVVLSDIIGDPLDMIASGPAYPDSSTSADALAVADKYGLELSDRARQLLGEETPKALDNVESLVTGSVRVLCQAAQQEARRLGYETAILTDSLSCQAREAGGFLASIAQYHRDSDKSLCFIAGGETVVRLKGKGKGGRNQELALGAAQGIADIPGCAVFSLGSDGTDGPTDAAGGYVDFASARRLYDKGIDIYSTLENNDAYPALQAVDGLIMTGPTGTNINDLSVVLLKR